MRTMYQPLLPLPYAVRSGTRRMAAVMIASLPVDDANYLMRQLSATELEELADQIAALDQVDSSEQSNVIDELAFARSQQVSLAPQRDSSDTTNWRLQQARKQLVEAGGDNLATALNNELPQLIAAVLTQLPPKTSGNTLRRFSTDRQLAIVKQMANASSISTATAAKLLQHVSDAIECGSRPLQDRATGACNYEAVVAEVIHHTDRATEKALLENLSEEDRGLVDRLIQRIHVLRDSRRPQLKRDTPTIRRAG